MPRTETTTKRGRTAGRAKNEKSNQRRDRKSTSAASAKQVRGRKTTDTRAAETRQRRKPAEGRKPAEAKGRARGRTMKGMPKAVRNAKGLSKSVQRAKWIESPDDHADRPGQSLATQSHEVIRQWADQRGAKPATVPGTEHEQRAGVLRFDFPGYGGRRLEEISWGDWFETFDQRRLVFLFQEQKRDGVESNFFRLDNPEREDA